MNKRSKRRNKRNRCFIFEHCTYSHGSCVTTDNMLGDILKACEIIGNKPHIKEWPVLLCTQEWFDKNKDSWKPKTGKTETIPFDLGIEIKVIDRMLLGDCEYRFVPKKCIDYSFMPVMVNDRLVGISTFTKSDVLDG